MFSVSTPIVKDNNNNNNDNNLSFLHVVDKADLFTGVLYNGYGPPGGFCWDQFCNDDPIMVRCCLRAILNAHYPSYALNYI